MADASPLPVVLYNVPGRTGVNMTAATTLSLARDCENIIGIKEASGNFAQIEEIIKNKPKRFEVISGDDSITYPLMTLGAVGVISVIGNAFLWNSDVWCGFAYKVVFKKPFQYTGDSMNYSTYYLSMGTLPE